ncbi:MAG: lipoyl synthase [Deltaproteobacteria bacterium]|nr:lipoyl synthase [Deltaproteobacteria bacterium]
MLKKPEWMRKRLPLGSTTKQVEEGLSKRNLHTICQEGCCPNQGECFSNKEASFLIMGRICSRNCRFCAVESGRPEKLDPHEPGMLAEEVQELGLKYVVITSVTRDDLPDGGAGHFALVIKELSHLCPDVRIEVLIPDFKGSVPSLATVIHARPDVLNHNVETIPRLYKDVRPQANYEQSIDLIRNAKSIDGNIITKSGLMVGLGETPSEVLEVMDDLRGADCDILTIGQYLQPSKDHYSLREYVHPDTFKIYEDEAKKRGFKGVVSSPFVRSSYRAGELYKDVIS